MDVNKTLRELYEEKRRLDAIIANLEANLIAPNAKSVRRRGRKSMSPQERLKVSSRMARYWEKRRAQMQSPQTQTNSGRIAETDERSKSQAAGHANSVMSGATQTEPLMG